MNILTNSGQGLSFKSFFDKWSTKIAPSVSHITFMVVLNRSLWYRKIKIFCYCIEKLFRSMFLWTHSNQSTAIIKEISSDGSPTVSNTITIVTKPAEGIPAAPIEAAVAVTLELKKNVFQMKLPHNKIKRKFETVSN